MKRKPLKLPPREQLVYRFIYNEDTGEFLHRHSLKGKHKANEPAGYVNNTGYLSTWAVNGYYLVHRIIWKMVHDEEPVEIDHKDRNRLNNKLDNLRAATECTNQQNRKRSNEHVGIRYELKGRYSARIQVNYKQIYLGTFWSLEQALEARREAEEKYNRKLI